MYDEIMMDTQVQTQVSDEIYDEIMINKLMMDTPVSMSKFVQDVWWKI